MIWRGYPTPLFIAQSLAAMRLSFVLAGPLRAIVLQSLRTKELDSACRRRSDSLPQIILSDGGPEAMQQVSGKIHGWVWT
jgi:hypothetical protein